MRRTKLEPIGAIGFLINFLRLLKLYSNAVIFCGTLANSGASKAITFVTLVPIVLMAKKWETKWF